MSKQIVVDFFEMQSKRAEKGAGGEKPIFLISTLQYMLEKDEIGTDLIELLRIKHTRFIKSRFAYLADRRLKDWKASWNQLTAYGKEEMKDQVEKYIIKKADVSKAFSNLSRNGVKELHDRFLEQLKQTPIMSLKNRID